ncbi:glycosyltransferase family 2 protein [Colwelliaceae bacterium 6441]
MHSPLIIIPAHNEQQTIAAVITDLRLNGFKQILVIDDASTDNTLKVVKECGVIVMSIPFNIGAWKATQAGLRYAYEKGFKHAITFDADGQHLASELKLLINHQIETDKDIIIGSCLSRGTKARHVAWQFFRKLSGIKIKDLTSGLRLYNAKAIDVLSRKEATLLEYQDVGVLLLLRSFKVSKGEVEVKMQGRTAGISRIFYSWWAVFYYMAYTTLLCFCKLAKTNQLISAPRISIKD